MTYSSQQKIQAGDYNAIAGTVGSGPSIYGQWGVGSGRNGLGQNTSSLVAVATSTRVTATQWANLVNVINQCSNHQGKPIISNPPAGNPPTVQPITAGMRITAYQELLTKSQAAFNNSGSIASGLLSDTAATDLPFSGTWGTTGGKALVFTHTVTFGSGNAARYFFNAGGRLKLNYSRTGGSINGINQSWAVLASNCGTLAFGYQTTSRIGGSGSSSILLDGTGGSLGGYWSGTGSPITHFRQYDSSTGYYSYYSGDYVQMSYYWSGVGQNGGYPVLNLISTWVNSSGVAVNGTAKASLVVSSPATTYLTNTWGNPVVGGNVVQA